MPWSFRERHFMGDGGRGDRKETTYWCVSAFLALLALPSWTLFIFSFSL
jgi:hypothetical protein